MLLAGCATTTTRPPEIDPALVRAEEEKQRQAVLETSREQQERLDRLAYPLLRAAGPLCGDHRMPWPGFRSLTLDDVDREWREAARSAWGLGDSLRIWSVVPGGPAERAGLRPGDRLVRVDGRPVATDASGSRGLLGYLRARLPMLDSLAVEVVRRGRPFRVDVALDTVCAYETVVVPSMAVNAGANGSTVYVTTGMMRFAEDDELSSIIAHEIAHNAQRHLRARGLNAGLGMLFGLIGDLATVASGDTLPHESYTSYFGGVGARAHSREFEREADYVGLYILALAGRPLEGAPRIFREFAAAQPESIGYSSTHPTHAERFLLMEAAIQEIEAKRRAGAPLRPEQKQE